MSRIYIVKYTLFQSITKNILGNNKVIFTSQMKSAIAVVGEGMLDRPGIAARVFGAVSRHKINILIISAGASSVAIYFIIAQKDREKTIQSIHQEFFG